ncbi:hypothetical protein EXIGLDRAFT_700170 [Exidia glandulosa HHB12029]|uniref:F-box domain-containing protein n=1 Tax=Exidia glandulosa HHB12029 TaxID=1314781 RepID=A0A165DJR5_EXIGL|nr:hypothetical protein EXIGLDRAFT_700170 [Exidia glandulosa HHB12029]
MADIVTCAVARAARAFNAKLSVNRLPAEVLTAIFAFLPVPCRFTATHVCTHWRTVGLDCPALWSTISITRRSNLDCIRTLFLRSKAAALRVALYVQNADLLTRYEPVVHWITYCLPRTTSLDLKNVTQIALGLLETPHPALQELRIGAPVDDFESGLEGVLDAADEHEVNLRQPFTLSAPRLTDLSIRLPNKTNPFLPTLKNVALPPGPLGIPALFGAGPLFFEECTFDIIPALLQGLPSVEQLALIEVEAPGPWKHKEILLARSGANSNTRGFIRPMRDFNMQFLATTYAQTIVSLSLSEDEIKGIFFEQFPTLPALQTFIYVATSPPPLVTSPRRWDFPALQSVAIGSTRPIRVRLGAIHTREVSTIPFNRENIATFVRGVSSFRRLKRLVVVNLELEGRRSSLQDLAWRVDERAGCHWDGLAV